MQKENDNKVSVIIPVYNVEKYLDECVQSVLNQTYKNLEIILVDDGSPDNCPKMCDEYAQKDDRVIVIHKPNGGQSSARNLGINIATGKYLFFVDSDDYVAEDIVDTLLREALARDSKITACGYTSDLQKLNKNTKNKVFVYSSKKALKKLFQEKKITTAPWAKLFDASLFDNIRYQEGKIYEDLGTIYKVVDKTDKVVVLDTLKYYYRYNPNSTTQSTFNRKQMDYFEIIDEIKEYVKEKHPKFLRLVVHHEVRNSIAFMRRISMSGFDDQGIIDRLTRKVRKGICGYLFSSYSIFSKLYGLLISISPKLALGIFQRK